MIGFYMPLLCLCYRGVLFNDFSPSLKGLFLKKYIIFFSQASIKRASEQLLYNISLEKRRKIRWDFVLEEMAWMANDFMQVQFKLIPYFFLVLATYINLVTIFGESTVFI
jgi:hypothetical protein